MFLSDVCDVDDVDLCLVLLFDEDEGIDGYKCGGYYFVLIGE